MSTHNERIPPNFIEHDLQTSHITNGIEDYYQANLELADQACSAAGAGGQVPCSGDCIPGGSSGECVNLNPWQYIVGWCLCGCSFALFLPQWLSILHKEANAYKFLHKEREEEGGTCACVRGMGRTPFSFFCLLAFAGWLVFVSVFALSFDALHRCCATGDGKGELTDLSSQTCAMTAQPVVQGALFSSGVHMIVLLYLNFFERKCVFAGIHVAR